jgi:Ala-tRNA(Pro) deacylase
MLPKPLSQMLEQEKISYEVIPHPRAYTAQGVAAMLHVSGREFAKSVVVKTRDGRTLIAVLPGSRHLDLKGLEELLHAEAELAPEAELQRLFPDCELGAEPPFGNLYRLPVYVDSALAKDPEIVFNAGNHTEAVRMKYADFERLVHPVVARLSRGH